MKIWKWFYISYLYKNIRSTLIFLSMYPIWTQYWSLRRELFHVWFVNVSSYSGNQLSNSCQRKSQKVKGIEGPCFKDLLCSWYCNRCALVQRGQVFTLNCISYILYCHYVCHIYGCSKIFSKEKDYPQNEAQNNEWQYLNTMYV